MLTFAPLRQASVAKNSKGVEQVRIRDIRAFQQTQKTRGTETPKEPVEEEAIDVSQQLEAAFESAKEQWDNIENKSTLAVYLVGGVSILWLSNTIVGAVNKVPVLPQLMEFVGLTYTAWFVYRYLLFKANREELLGDVENLKKKVRGD